MSLTRTSLALTGLLMGIAAAWLMLANRVRPASAADVTLVLAVGWSFLASGTVAWRLRPDNLIGPAMVATGLLRLAQALTWSQDPVVFAVGHFLDPAYLAGIAFVVLAFPSGRLEAPFLRVLFAAAVVAAGPLHVLWVVTGGEMRACPGCPQNLLALADAPDLAGALQFLHPALGLLVAALSIGVLFLRWHRASAALRFEIAPVVWVAAGMFAALTVRLAAYLLRDPFGEAPALVLDLTLALVAVAFLAGLARTRLARSAVADLLVHLGTSPAADLRDRLARALRDPSLEIAYWSPSAGCFVDSAGRPAEPAAGSDRAVTVVERRGTPIAALVHDPAAGEDESLVQAVAAAAGLQLENERLQADLRAQLEEVRASRTRIVEATHEERRRIERDLHDGTQQRLVSVAMALGLANAKVETDPAAAGALIGEARGRLSDALTELRELSQGIHPSVLTERGLASALDELAQRMQLPVALDVTLGERLPPPVETAAYYVVSEALTNVAKHAAASHALVRVGREAGQVTVAVSDDGRGGADARKGSGLRGLQDRVEALGGRLVIDSSAGQGTVLRARFPCG